MTLSIGRIGGIGYDATGDRLKGVLTDVAKDVDDVESTLDRCIQGAGLLGSRFTVRIFTEFRDPEPLQNIRSVWNGAEVRCEAFIPHKRCGVAYFGGNSAHRRSSNDIIVEEQKLLQKVTEQPVSEKVVPDKFWIEMLNRPTRTDIADLLAVYNASYTAYITEFNADSIGNMIFENHVAVARNGDGRIVAVSQGESAPVPQVGVTLVEISDTATHPNYRSLGLTTLCKMKLIEELKRSSDAIIFAESRAVSGAVLRQNYSVGMRFGGRLDRHTKIASEQADIRQEGQYGNIVVCYLPTI